MQIFLINGKGVDVSNIKSEDIDIEAIAHSLSNICRYAGHVEYFYSVAEHCVLLAGYFQKNYPLNLDFARIALLHDAAESFISDIPAPVKDQLDVRNGPEQMDRIIDLETKILWAVEDRFRARGPLTRSETGKVDEADKRIRANELCIRPKEAAVICKDLVPLKGVEIQCWSPSVAKLAFLKKFRELFPEEKIGGDKEI